MNNQYKASLTVSFGDVGPDMLLTPAAMTGLFQSVINEHTNEMEIGVDTLREGCRGKWIISRMRAEIARMPRYGESITVETWPLRPSALIMPRCIRILDARGEQIIGSYGEWCVLDIETNAPIRTSVFTGHINLEYRTDRAAQTRFRMGRFQPEEADFRFRRTMRYSDLDSNGHVNNVTDIRLLSDCFSAAELGAHPPKCLEVAYSSQCYEGEEMALYRRGESVGVNQLCGRVGDRVVFGGLLELA